jgi:hypothetical protein
VTKDFQSSSDLRPGTLLDRKASGTKRSQDGISRLTCALASPIFFRRLLAAPDIAQDFSLPSFAGARPFSYFVQRAQTPDTYSLRIQSTDVDTR